jgi:hydantoinase/carbamoylase family amidase
MTGSRAWTGQIGQDELERVRDGQGISYLEAMARAGLAPDDHSILRPEQVKAMVELHIEQSVVLERKDLQIGVVEAIAGIRQLLVTISGVSNHAGATPMALRHDALQGAAEIISAIETIAARHSGRSTVATVGSITCEPGQANVIPGRVQFTVDIRDRDACVLEGTVQEVVNQIAKICQRRGLECEVITRSDTPPVTLSKEMVRILASATVARGMAPLGMPSGALHDSSILAEMTEVGMIFVPSVNGRCHCPV